MQSRNVEKFLYNLKRYGLGYTLKKVSKRVFHKKKEEKFDNGAYIKWIQNNEPDIHEIENQKNTKFKYNPKISVVIPMYNTNDVFFVELLQSFMNQTYVNFEICIADGSEIKNEKIEEYIKSAELQDKVKYKFLGKNGGISENTNKAIELATGDYIGFMDHDDLISDNCLFEVVKKNNDEDPDCIYSDEDKIENGVRFEPYFKPDYSPEMLECNNYITHFVVVKKSILDKVGRLDSRFDGAQDFDLLLRISENTNKISHISKILYHWRSHKNSTAELPENKKYAYEAGLKVVEKHIKRTGKDAEVLYGNDVPGVYKIKYNVRGNPKVSIIIPNKDNVGLLSNCIKSILKLTTYKNYEIIIVENNSTSMKTYDFYDEIVKNERVKVYNYNSRTIQDMFYQDSLGQREFEDDDQKKMDAFSKEFIEEDKSKFNYSKLINFAVRLTDTDYIVQLNNDTKIISPDWLETMIGYYQQNNEIGAIGGRLYYSDKSIQHAGIAVGIGGYAANLLVNLPYGKHAYYGYEAITRDVLAVTGAMLFTSKIMYDEVGYMDDKNLQIALNDVDFCLKIYEKGYRILYNPYIEIWHYESKSRGYENTENKEARFNEEIEYFKNKWKKYIDYDPYYNINFTRKNPDFKINLERHD